MLKCIEKEMELRKMYLENKIVKTIYFGGGTPSMLQASEIEKILQNIYQNYLIDENIEITLECNPDDITEEKLYEFKRIGINRLSIGVQSFDNEDLKFMNRSHNATQSKECIQMAKEVGFNNITIDLIYGLPNQTLEKWEKNLNLLFDLDIQHFSPYALTVEKKTTLKHLVDTKKVSLISDEEIVEQFNLLTNKAKEKGFVHYEISNFGKIGFFSNHNTAYWKNKYYLGIGPSAHSFNRISRRWNVKSNKKYIEGILNNANYFETEILGLKQQYNEYIFTSLRTIWGVDSNFVKNNFNAEMHKNMQKTSKKWLKKKYLTENGNILRLTEKGKLMADAIASDFFEV